MQKVKKVKQTSKKFCQIRIQHLTFFELIITKSRYESAKNGLQ
jgi:hypothetical protein